MSKKLIIEGVEFTKAQWAALCDYIGNEVDMQENNEYSKKELEEIHTLDRKLGEVMMKAFSK